MLKMGYSGQKNATPAAASSRRKPGAEGLPEKKTRPKGQRAGIVQAHRAESRRPRPLRWREEEIRATEHGPVSAAESTKI